TGVMQDTLAPGVRLAPAGNVAATAAPAGVRTSAVADVARAMDVAAAQLGALRANGTPAIARAVDVAAAQLGTLRAAFQRTEFGLPQPADGDPLRGYPVAPAAGPAGSDLSPSVPGLRPFVSGEEGGDGAA